MLPRREMTLFDLAVLYVLRYAVYGIRTLLYGYMIHKTIVYVLYFAYLILSQQPCKELQVRGFQLIIPIRPYSSGSFHHFPSSGSYSCKYPCDLLRA